MFEIGADGQGQARRVAAQHRRGEVEGEQRGGRIGAGEAGEGVAGAAAGVEDALGAKPRPVARVSRRSQAARWTVATAS